MKSSLVYGLALALLLALLGGCREASELALDPAGAGGVVEMGTGDQRAPESHRRGINAHGHFQWQLVELVEQDGSTADASFRADYVVHDHGRAAGSFAFLTEEGMVVYRITGGRVTCVGGTDVVVLNATAVGANSRSALDVTVDVKPAGETNPDCIIWDIQDGCSHEATGKYNVLDGACGG